MDTRKRRRRQDGKKKHIVTAAGRLAAKQGLDGFSLADVARAAGISKGTLYYYYTTKSALVFDIAARHVNDITAFILELIEEGGPDADPVDLLALFFRRHQANRTRMRLHLNLVHQAMHGDRTLKERYQAIYAHWRQEARQALAGLLPDSPHRETLTSLIITTVDGINVQSMLDIDATSTEDIARFLIAAART
ncbi:MAG: TetR/AcrR family transcriptional regulator [Desulfobacterales bacterium]|nr:TetR/AcrR family transcriptional regulator [Desulfobacterales bacterium]MDJ0854075.1 TetR/AcrR family transcriptional regulator [Desulfobacterales bacterium]MDJ0889538.1 TetR/AcrR family transcriptional regulator [Desulfobacterales bacterium]MDJ0989676.1 TetR/AcrR family transcriptional regulator [Desulfobacterales bacterium]